MSHYGHWCGVGNDGQEPLDDMDECCKQHDGCYDAVMTSGQCEVGQTGDDYVYISQVHIPGAAPPAVLLLLVTGQWGRLGVRRLRRVSGISYFYMLPSGKLRMIYWRRHYCLGVLLIRGTNMVTIQPKLMTPGLGLGLPSARARHVSVMWAWHSVYRGPGSVHHQCLDCWGRSGGKLGDNLKFHSDNFPLQIWKFIVSLFITTHDMTTSLCYIWPV